MEKWKAHKKAWEHLWDMRNRIVNSRPIISVVKLRMDNNNNYGNYAVSGGSTPTTWPSISRSYPSNLHVWSKNSMTLSVSVSERKSETVRNTSNERIRAQLDELL